MALVAQDCPSDEEERHKDDRRRESDRRREDERQRDHEEAQTSSRSLRMELQVQEERRQRDETRRRNQEMRPQSRNEMSSQAIRALVRLNEQRVLLDSAGLSLKIMSRLKMTLMWIVMSLFMWNWMELEKFGVRFKELGGGRGELKCDHTLYGRDYVLDTWYSIMILVTPIGRLLHANCFLRRCCDYEADLAEFPVLHASEEGSMNLFPETMRPGRPLRVQLLTALFLVFHICWSIVGIYWCCQEDACKNLNPRLALSVGIMCCVMLVYVALSQISHLQIARLVQLMTQESAERAQAAAVARMAGCEAIELDSAGRSGGEELPSDCPICMDALLDDCALPSEGNCLVPGVCKTPCGHFFHESCLQRWASRSGSCPLCRSNLTDLVSGSSERLAGPSAAELRQLLSHLDAHAPERAEVMRSILGGSARP